MYWSNPFILSTKESIGHFEGKPLWKFLIFAIQVNSVGFLEELIPRKDLRRSRGKTVSGEVVHW